MQDAPLAWRMRPRTIDEVVGQSHLLGPGMPLRAMIERGLLRAAVFYGPPGCGKTALAHVIAEQSKADFIGLNAVSHGVKEIRAAVEKAFLNRRQGSSTLLFIDEIHRFTKVQQESLLPHVEEGLFVLLGASTENPRAALSRGLASRLTLFAFKPLSNHEIHQLLLRALRDPRGLKDRGLSVAEEAFELIEDHASGDARRALNALELAAITAEERGLNQIEVDLVAEVLGTRASSYLRSEHYDVISAYIKSIRGSDPDAALFWMARMLQGGEDPLFIARRLVIASAEDVGCADPMALVVATAALKAVEAIGMPECAIPLAEATVYAAAAPKSNSAYLALKKAQADAEDPQVNAQVPPHITNRAPGSRDYRYPHDYPGHFVKQSYLPEPRLYYLPTDLGRERLIKERLLQLWGRERYGDG